MKNNPFYFIANWKMYLTHNQSCAFITQYMHELNQLNTDTTRIIICPSFTALAPIAQQPNLECAVGAQTCSDHEQGAYTGEVSAHSLKQIGCSYCIVGHSERRMNYRQNSEIIAKKAQLLLRHDISPIICIGEREQDYKDGTTVKILKEQLAPIHEVINQAELPVFIAYEPIWAIGTGAPADVQHLKMVFAWLREQFANNTHVHFFYGGSVNDDNSAALMKIPHVDGFLIGSASTDFQKFKNIVLLK